MAEEIKNTLDHERMIVVCEGVIRSLAQDEGDLATSTRELLGSAIVTFQNGLAHNRAENALPELKAKVDQLLVQDGETYRALDAALDQARADDLHGEEKKERLRPAREARDAARKALSLARKAVNAAEREIIDAYMRVNMSSQALMHGCLHHAVFAFGTSTDRFEESRAALKVLVRSGITADTLQSAAQRISDYHAPYVRGEGNVLTLQRTRTPDEVRSNAMEQFLGIFLPELARSKSFGALACEEGHTLLSMFAEPLVAAFRQTVYDETRLAGEGRAAAAG